MYLLSIAHPVPLVLSVLLRELLWCNAGASIAAVSDRMKDEHARAPDTGSCS
jgi:hypothetical protein